MAKSVLFTLVAMLVLMEVSSISLRQQQRGKPQEPEKKKEEKKAVVEKHGMTKAVKGMWEGGLAAVVRRFDLNTLKKKKPLAKRTTTHTHKQNNLAKKKIAQRRADFHARRHARKMFVAAKKKKKGDPDADMGGNDHDVMGDMADSTDSEAHDKAMAEGMGEDGCLEPPSGDEITDMMMTDACFASCENQHPHGDSADMAAKTDEHAEDLYNCHTGCMDDPEANTPKDVQDAIETVLETCKPSEAANTPAPECMDRCLGEAPFDEEAQYDAMGNCMETFMMCVETEACLMACPGEHCPAECGMGGGDDDSAGMTL